MKIKKLTLSGFKSFCEETSIVFDNSITSIVGPNGCGKSNILDAVRWALGEISVKTMRGRSMEDVIFYGSEKRHAKSMAEVTILFDNQDGLSHHAYTEYTEISVTRKLSRDGISEYFINNMPCRKMDITDLFLGTGGGPRTYSIIEQGQIGVIVTSKPEDRRVIIEEAAGITKYRHSRRSAGRRMEKTRQNLLRVSDIIVEMERSLSSLKRQAQKAKRYKKYKEELTSLELYESSHKYLELSAKNTSISHLLKDCSLAHLKSQDDLALTETKVDELKLSLEKIRVELENEVKVNYERNSHISQIENEIKSFKETINTLKERDISLDKQNKVAISEVKDLENEREELLLKSCKVKKSNSQAQKCLEELEQKSSGARGKLQNAGLVYDEKRDWLGRTRARLAATQNALLNFDTRILEAEKQKLNATVQLADIHKEAASVKKKIVNFDEEVVSVNKQIESIDNLNKREKIRRDELALSVESSDLKRTSIRSELQDKKARKASFEELMVSFTNHDSNVRGVLKSLTKKNDLKKILGLLLDKVNCPQNIECALAAALGHNLQGILVKNQNEGVSLLKEVKENDLGRITVFASDEIPENNLKTKIKVLKNKLLFDSLNISDCALKPIQKLLANVYLVEDLKTALGAWKECRGQYAFVTMDGQLVNKDGSMTGGSEKNKGARLLGQKRKISQLDTQVKKLSKDMEITDEHFAALKGELAVCNETLEKYITDSQILAIKRAEISKDHKRTKEDLLNFDTRRSGLKMEIAHHDEMLRKTRADKNEAKREVKETLIEIEKLTGQVKEFGKRVDVHRMELERLAGETSDVRIQQASMEQQILAAAQRSGSILESIKKIEARREGFGSDKKKTYRKEGMAWGNIFKNNEVLQSLLLKTKTHEKLVLSLRSKLEEYEHLTKEHENLVKDIRKTTDELASNLARLNLEKQELEIELQHLVEDVYQKHDLNLLHVLTDYHLLPIPDISQKSRRKELLHLLDRMGSINLNAILEFESENTRYMKISEQKNDLEQALEDLERAISKMDRDSKRRFKHTFEDVNTKFSELFSKLFGGGKAQLVLTDPDNLLTTGIDVEAQPPGKKAGNIELLSGGEKTLTAVSLIFAVFLHRPSPFCILDEVDSNLDESNLVRFIEMVGQLTKRSQFVLMTHANATMERSDMLYGVTMEEPGISKLVSVRVKKQVEVDKAVNAN